MAVAAPAPEPIIETFYLAPIYTGIIVMNPPEKKAPKGKRHPEAAKRPETASDPPSAPRPETDDPLIPRSEESGRRAR
jgi:hypothetical protein